MQDEGTHPPEETRHFLDAHAGKLLIAAFAIHAAIVVLTDGLVPSFLALVLFLILAGLAISGYSMRRSRKARLSGD